MKPLHRAPVAALVALLVAVCPGAARAAERGCPGANIEPDADFRARFADLLESIESELSARADIDACAHAWLRAEPDGVITVTVALPDGRATSRSVTRREDVIPTLQALLVVPASTLPAASVFLKRAEPAPLHRAAFLAESTRAERGTPPPVGDATSRLGVELSVVTGARLGDGQAGIGVGALSFFRVNGWLLGFQGRADSYRRLLGGDPETALELALLTGRRFDLGGVTLDLTAGPGVAMKGFALGSVVVERSSVNMDGAMAPAPLPQEDAKTGPVPRLLLGARIGLGPRSVFRTFFGFDGELGPARQANDAGPYSSRLPTYTLGLALGATVGTL